MWKKLLNTVESVFGESRNRSIHSNDVEPSIDFERDLTVESLVDPTKLQILALQRRTLDWRDDAHAEIMRTAHIMQARIALHVESEMNKLSLVEKLIAKPAKKVLGGWFASEVMHPLQLCLRREQSKLATFHANSSDFIFDKEAFDTLSWLATEVFRPSRKNQIIKKSHEWLLGSEGIAACYCKQASSLAKISR